MASNTLYRRNTCPQKNAWKTTLITPSNSYNVVPSYQENIVLASRHKHTTDLLVTTDNRWEPYQSAWYDGRTWNDTVSVFAQEKPIAATSWKWDLQPGYGNALDDPLVAIDPSAGSWAH